MGTRVHPSWPPQLKTDAHVKPRDGPVQHRKLSLSAKEDLKSALDAVMAKYRPKLPGIGFGIATADGAVYEAYIGDRVYGEPDSGPVDGATTYMIYSMTKLVTSLALLQAVESGLLSYDDPACVEKYVPELCSQKVLLSYSPRGPVFEEREEPLTLRRLVTHTSGLAYWAMDITLHAYLKSIGRDVVFTPTLSEMEQPLRAQPGQKWMYGPGLDWAGVVLERSTGRTLESLFRERIFEPLGISTETSFAPRLKTWQHTVRRTQSGLELAEPMKPPTEVPQQQGGDGLWSTLPDYLKLCAGVLRSAQPGGVISPGSYTLLWEDSIPSASGAHSNDAHRDLATFLSNSGAKDTTPEDVGHSVAAQVRLKDLSGGRKKGSASWGGAGLTQFCIDARSGIAFVAMTQIEKRPDAPMGQEPFVDFWAEMEKTMYQYL